MHDVSPQNDRKTWTSTPEADAGASVRADVRGLRYGDGVFVTLAIRSGLVLDARRQLDRLRAAAEHVGLTPPSAFAGPADAPRILAALLRDLGAGLRSDEVARVQWHAGPGSRGFGRTDVPAEAMVDLGPAPPPRRPAVVVLEESEAPLPALPRWKTCSALAHVLCERSARALGADTGIRTLDGSLLEAGSANLFWLHGSRLRTPAADLPIYPGSVRERVFEAALDAGLPVEEGDYGTEALEEADAVILTNAVRGLEFAISVDGRLLPDPPGIALALADAVAARRAAAGVPLPGGRRDSHAAP